MSRSTQKYGKVTLHARTSIESNPTLPLYIVNQHKNLDDVSVEKFGVKYSALSGDQKSDVHLIVKERRKAKYEKQNDLAESHI